MKTTIAYITDPHTDDAFTTGNQVDPLPDGRTELYFTEEKGPYNHHYLDASSEDMIP